MNLLEEVRKRAQKLNKTIILPESTEARTINAADQVLKEGIANIILLAHPEAIRKAAAEHGLENIEKANIINPKHHDKKQLYVDLLMELRKNKGLTKEEAEELVEDPLYLSSLIIKNGDADGEVAGAENSTGDVLRPAFQIVKTRPEVSVVSGAFFMTLQDKQFGENGLLVFADGAVNPNPTEEQLAEIALTTAETTRIISGIEPRIAMLSFSTHGSAQHEMIDKVVNATNMAKKKKPDLQIDGEMQVDAALIDHIGKRKAPGSEIAGKANVLIFPSLEAGNIGYKLVQRLAHAVATGPILQGLAAPINDLSRGCSMNDIVDMIAITSNLPVSKGNVKHKNIEK